MHRIVDDNLVEAADFPRIINDLGGDVGSEERSLIDKRLVTIMLTAEGSRLISRVQKDWRDLEVEVTADLSPSEKRDLAALCRKMSDSARKLRARRGARRGVTPELPDPSEFLNTNGHAAPPRQLKKLTP